MAVRRPHRSAAHSIHTRPPGPNPQSEIAADREELSHLIGAVERKGYTLVPLSMYWKHGRAKAKIGLAKGKKQHDKRAAIREREWQRDKARLLKKG